MLDPIMGVGSGWPASKSDDFGRPAGRPNEACLENKVEIRFGMQRPKADGRGMVDDFDVEVRNKNLNRT
jgi:hypothetical protein